MFQDSARQDATRQDAAREDVTRQDSGRQDRADTRAAKVEERAATARQVWAEVEAKTKARDENTDRLKAARLAREAEIAAEAAAAPARTAKRKAG